MNIQKRQYLPKESYLSNLKALKAHQNLKHRQLVKSVIRKRILCRRFECKPYPNPLSAQLPEFRCQRSLPFQTIGVDYFGPLLVKPTYNSAESNNKFLAKVNVA